MTDLALDPIEQKIVATESGGRPFVGTGGADLSNAPLDASGFPIWSGLKTPRGISYHAGLFQLGPSEWHQYAQPGESFDNPADQVAVERRLRSARGLAPWVPYNPQLAAQLGMKGYNTGMMPPGVSPGPDVDWSSLRDHSLAALGGGTPAGALPDRPLSSSPAAPSSSWSRLMAFSMIKQLSALGTHKFEPVDYDPWKVASSGQ